MILALISALSAFLISTTTLAQTDININNSNILRVGGDVTVAENQVVQNAIAIGGDVTIQPKARVTKTAIAVGGDVVLKENARVDGDVYTVGGEIIIGQKRILTTPKRTVIQQFLIGLLVVGLIGLIPVLGGLFLLIVNILGLGAVLAWKFS